MSNSNKKPYNVWEKPYFQWFANRNWQAFPYQYDAAKAILEDKSGLVNAPTGSGKTFSVWIPILLKYQQVVEEAQKKLPKGKKPEIGLFVLWITPVRALANDLSLAMQNAANELGIAFEVQVRSGDTDTKTRDKQRKKPPQALVTTPESLHLLMATKGYKKYFENLSFVVIDEWHELVGSKRGVQMELALSHLKGFCKHLKIWAISATIGNMEEAKEVLLGNKQAENHPTIKAAINKKLRVVPIFPDEVEMFPWGGHLGIKMLPKVLEIINASEASLVFTNTRAQCEIWFQRILEAAPELAGTIALHHGSLSNEIREWVENALRAGKLKVVVCTSSLDLGVDFRSVETIVQIGGPKGVARFLQRAGRSGHRPDAESLIYFVPTHSLELIESAALRKAIENEDIEPQRPIVRAFDVLIQWLVTLSLGEGFSLQQVYEEVKTTHCYKSINYEEFLKALKFITDGGEVLKEYEEFCKVRLEENGTYKVKNRAIAMRHRVSIGTIVQENMVSVKFITGGYIGSVEEYFVSKMKLGTVFGFAGRTLELVQFKEGQALVRNSKKKTGIIATYAGGKMPLSSQLAKSIRSSITDYKLGRKSHQELVEITPLLDRQEEISLIPDENQFLIEQLKSREGVHIFFYTFEGRYVNEGMASLIAMRIGEQKQVTFSISVTDYGFELLTDLDDFEIEQFLEIDIFTADNLLFDIQKAMNTAQLAMVKFRAIAQIAGLTFAGMPGKEVKTRHLQANSKLFFKMFSQYDAGNLLLQQAYDEVLYDQLDENRLRAALLRIKNQQIVLKRVKRPSPFCFPIMVERIRDKFSNEPMEERVKRMIKQFEQADRKTS